LGEGIRAKCRLGTANGQSKAGSAAAAEESTEKKADLSSLGSLLQARWKGEAPGVKAKQEAVRAGQIRQFRITRLDAAAKQIEVELA
jgi:small subunit ribosomal protein S1